MLKFGDGSEEKERLSWWTLKSRAFERGRIERVGNLGWAGLIM
jgi:hypothetical protein